MARLVTSSDFSEDGASVVQLMHSCCDDDDDRLAASSGGADGRRAVAVMAVTTPVAEGRGTEISALGRRGDKPLHPPNAKFHSAFGGVVRFSREAPSFENGLSTPRVDSVTPVPVAPVTALSSKVTTETTTKTPPLPLFPPPTATGGVVVMTTTAQHHQQQRK